MAIVFPLIRTQDGASTEIHLYNPNDSAVEVRLAGYHATGQPATLSQPTVTLNPHERRVASSADGSSPLSLPFNELDGGYVLAETVRGAGIMGMNLYREAVGRENNLASLNALELPIGCRANWSGLCEPDPTIPGASQQHSAYAIHFEPGLVDKELMLVNVSGRDAPVALSLFDTNGQFRVSQPRTGFMALPAHSALRVAVTRLAGVDVSQQGGVIRVEDPFSVIVGTIVNRDAQNRRFLTAYPLVADLAQEGREVTDAFLSRVQVEATDSGIDTGLFILNPNNNPVGFRLRYMDVNGQATQAPPMGVLTATPRGTFIQTRSSLGVVFANIRRGHLQVKAEEDARPGTGERLILYGVYRGQGFLSVIPPQP